MKNSKTKDALICLAAGESQVPIILAAKKLNYIVVAIDFNPKAVGFKFTDHNIICSTHDAAAVIKSLDILNDEYNWIGILNRSSGPAVITAAKISEHFNISGVPVMSAEILLNKDAMRDACSKFEFPSPTYKLLKRNEITSFKVDDYPIVVKPALSIVGKSGISVVRNKIDLKKAIDYATENTINNSIIIEKYIEGFDLSLISFVENNKLNSICYLNEINSEDAKGRIYGKGFKTFDINKNTNLKQKLDLIATKIVKKLEIIRSPFLVSFRIDKKGNVFLMEVHLDLGGDLLIEKLFPSALDIDFKELAVKMATGNINIPFNIRVSPSAVIYEKGSKLVSEKDCRVIVADTYQELEDLIVEQ